jgi:hypothetical protein
LQIIESVFSFFVNASSAIHVYMIDEFHLHKRK